MSNLITRAKTTAADLHRIRVVEFYGVAALLHELANSLELYEKTLLLWHRQQKYSARDNGNAPGHGHAIPGVWDDDNGDIAGHRCAECLLWSLAEKLAAAESSPKNRA